MDSLATASQNLSALGCFDQIKLITEEFSSLEALTRLNPGNDDIWMEITQEWMDFMKAAFIILGLIYFLLGVSSTVLLLKLGSLRLPIRTFFAVYLNMAILGYSRAFFLWLDPGGIIGFIYGRFAGWIVISRYLNVLGFPSLVASSTMIIFTLIKVVDVKAGRKWYEYWRYVILITGLAYGTALVAESLGHINSLAILITGTLCKIFFILWGAVICTIYLTAGFRLLFKLKICHAQSMKRSESQTDTRDWSKNLGKSRRIKQIFRRIIKITIGTALTGLVYSFVAAGDVTLTLYLVFHQCMDSVEKGNSIVWIFLQLSSWTVEIILSVFILYSITDVTKVKSFFRRCASSISGVCLSRRTSLVNVYSPKKCDKSCDESL